MVVQSSDVYSLGAMLYALLTGHPPFEAFSPVLTLQMVITQDPVAPSKIKPHIPRDLETICLKCLRKNPDGRYDSAMDVAEDLERFLDGKPIRARRVGYFQRTRLWCQRKPMAAFAVVMGVLMLLVILIAQRRMETADDLVTRFENQETANKQDLATARVESLHEAFIETAIAHYRHITPQLPEQASEDRSGPRAGLFHYGLGLLHLAAREPDLESALQQLVTADTILSDASSRDTNNAMSSALLAACLIDRSRLLQKLDRKDSATEDANVAAEILSNLEQKLANQSSTLELKVVRDCLTEVNMCLGLSHLKKAQEWNLSSQLLDPLSPGRNDSFALGR